MRTKNTALIVSKSQALYHHLSELLVKNQFEIFTIEHFKNWPLNLNQQNFDICFVDNRKNDFPYKQFLIEINQYSPQTIVVNLGNNKLKRPSSNNFIYNVNIDKETICLPSFVENMGEFFKRMRMRPKLAAMLIHDIRSPLNSLIGYIELLLNETFGSLNKGQHNFLEKSMLLGDQVIDMLEEVNEIYQNEQFSFTLDSENFSMADIINETLSNLWVQSDKKHIKIHKKISPNLPDVEGDSFQIQRVLVNMLDNAIKYCPPHSTITIQVENRSNRFIEISIINNGGKIAEEHLKKIFKKYFRLQKHREKYKGDGLGLYICKLIINAHRGTIQAFNNDQDGITFTFTLPYSQQY